MLRQKKNIRLQGHEKFIFRDGWMVKGFREISKDPLVFRNKNTPDVFGLGSNMVKSLRYWMKSCGLTQDTVKGVQITDFGNLINEYDVYLEDELTVAMLHWNLAVNEKDATSWYVFFHLCEVQNMTREEIFSVMEQRYSVYAEGNSVPEKSLKADIDILLKMYLKEDKVQDPEDKNHSDFENLNLLKASNAKPKTYSKNEWTQNSINHWIALYVLTVGYPEISSLSIDKLTNGKGGLAPVFQMNAIQINEALDKLENMGYIRVIRTAGLDMIYIDKSLQLADLFKDYYSSFRTEGIWGK